MQRLGFRERPDWRAQAENLGFHFHTFDGEPYWDERAAYRFSLRQIEDDIETPTGELHELCLDLVAEVVRSEALMQKLALPESHWDFIAESWRRGDPHLYGRMDLGYDGRGPARLYELNYDTPTSLYETAFFQWLWLEQMIASGQLPAGADQYNSLQEHLVEAFRQLPLPTPFYLSASEESVEDRGTVAYLQDCAAQAGLPTRYIDIERIGLDELGRFVDEQDAGIPALFKLYPWEFMLDETYGEALRHTRTRFLEPPWKLILSNKGALALLWERHPNHPNLLPCFFDEHPNQALPAGWVRKPFFSREGANIELHASDGQKLSAPGPYGGPCVRQAYHPLPNFDGNYTVLGSWIVGDIPCGLGIREDASLITQDSSRFLPHFIDG